MKVIYIVGMRILGVGMRGGGFANGDFNWMLSCWVVRSMLNFHLKTMELWPNVGNRKANSQIDLCADCGRNSR